MIEEHTPTQPEPAIEVIEEDGVKIEFSGGEILSATIEGEDKTAEIQQAINQISTITQVGMRITLSMVLEGLRK